METTFPKLPLPPAVWVFAVALGAFMLWVAGCSSIPKLNTSPATTADLSGQWELDRNASDNPEEAIQAAIEIAKIEGHGQREPHSGMHRGTPGSRPGQQAGETNRPAGRPPGAGTAQSGPNLLDLPDEFALTQTASALEMRSKQHGSQKYEAGATLTEVGPAGDREIHAGWDADAFVVIFAGPRDLKRTDRFTRSADGQSLAVETLLQGGMFREPLRLQRLYHIAARNTDPTGTQAAG